MSKSSPEVAVLLATYNGQQHLGAQLKSIVEQTIGPVKIIASDDGSTDKTLEILNTCADEVHNGPRQGFSANFLNLIEKVNTNSAYYAFSDQDDIWNPDKLERAIEFLKTVDPQKPALYCSRTLLVDEALKPLGYSPLFKKPPSFLNALVQSIGGGNTMVFNQAALKLLKETKNKSAIVSHDWWAYLLISGAGGTVFYDEKPSLHYRQHSQNLVGNNISLKARLQRVRLFFQGRLKTWIDSNNQNLADIAYLLTPQHRQQLEIFVQIRQSSFLLRFFRLLQLGIYRQTRLSHIGLLVGSIFNKL